MPKLLMIETVPGTFLISLVRKDHIGKRKKFGDTEFF